MVQNKSASARDSVLFLFSMVAIYLAIQTVIILAHEYTHSTAAWLLGYTRTPLTVVWGNPVTAMGWDEGVPYDRLFPSGGKAAEAAIGGLPLLMHTVFVVLGLYGLLRLSLTKRKTLFYTIYWFVVINLTELVAYILMRPFAGSGDTGRFNEGLAISPWYLFVTGTVFLIGAFYIFFSKVVPRLDIVADGSRMKNSILLWMTAFILFLWGSGLRIMSLYPDRQWKWGLIGVAAFPVWLLADRLRIASPLHRD